MKKPSSTKKIQVTFTEVQLALIDKIKETVRPCSTRAEVVKLIALSYIEKSRNQERNKKSDHLQ